MISLDEAADVALFVSRFWWDSVQGNQLERTSETNWNLPPMLSNTRVDVNIQH
jgi:hypothetical protein